MNTYKFETNIQSKAEVEQLGFLFETEPKIRDWEVDMHSSQRLLTIKAVNLSNRLIIDLLRTKAIKASSLFEE